MNPHKGSTRDNGGHSPTISEILIYINKRWAIRKGIITASFALMTLLERVLAAAIDNATKSHIKHEDEYGAPIAEQLPIILTNAMQLTPKIRRK